MNKLCEEFFVAALAEFDAETRFRTLAAQGDSQEALSILDRLGAQDAQSWFEGESSRAESREEVLGRFLAAQQKIQEALQGEPPEALGVDRRRVGGSAAAYGEVQTA